MKHEISIYCMIVAFLVAAIASSVIMGSGSDPGTHEHALRESIVAVTNGPVKKNELGIISAKRADGWSGFILEEAVKFRINERSHCNPSVDGYSFFVSEHLGDGTYKCLFEVFQKTNDTFKSVQKFIDSNNLSLYTNDFSRGVIWIPASCMSDINKCRSDIEFLRNHKESWEKDLQAPIE